MHHKIKLEYGDSVTIYTPALPPTKFDIVRKAMKSDEIDKYPIFDRVCKAFNIKMDELLGSRRQQHLVFARFIVSYDLIVNHNLQVTTVSRILCKHHTTIIYYLKTMRHMKKNNDDKLEMYQTQLEMYEKD